MSHFSLHVCGAYNSACVVEGVTATTAPGDVLAESLRATQEELSPAEERLSSSPGLHLWRLACLSTGLAEKQKGALGGFG